MVEDRLLKATFKPDVATRFDNFKNKEELKTDSAALRKLVTFALDIMDRTSEAPAVSNREIFEKILEEIKINSSMLSQAHGCSYRNDIVEDIKLESREARKAAREYGKNQTELFLAGE